MMKSKREFKCAVLVPSILVATTVRTVKTAKLASLLMTLLLMSQSIVAPVFWVKTSSAQPVTYTYVPSAVVKTPFIVVKNAMPSFVPIRTHLNVPRVLVFAFAATQKFAPILLQNYLILGARGSAMLECRAAHSVSDGVRYIAYCAVISTA